MYATTTLSRISQQDTKKINAVANFLQKNNLDIDRQISEFIVLQQQGDIVACGGLDSDILKCVAISPHLRGQGILLKLVTELINLAVEHGHTALFVYTRNENENLFRNCGFTPLVTIPGMVLMENSGSRLTHYLQTLAALRRPGKRISAIVMNANPFTNGHLHLVRYAAANSDWLHLFMVNEDASQFPFCDRLALVQSATEGIANITVHPGSRYIISRATFPAYFIKNKAQVADSHAQIDITLFRQYIAPTLGITQRIVGEEPGCPVTARYNRELRYWLSTSALPFAPIDLIEIPRLNWQKEPISASRVRELLRQKRLADAAPLVPDSTLSYLQHQLMLRPDGASTSLTETGKS